MRFRIASLLAALFLLVPALTIAQSNPSATVTISSASSTAGVSAAGGNGNGYGSCKVQVVAPSGFGTVTFEGTSGGSTQPLQAQLQVPGSAVATTATVPGLYTVDVSGMQSYDWRVSTYTSGPITFIWSCGNQPAVFVSTASGGGTYTAPPVQPVSGVGGAPVPVTTAAPYALATDAAGRIITSPSSAPSPCPTNATTGHCYTDVGNTIAPLTGGPYTANGTTTPITPSGAHEGCDLQTTSTWIGTIAPQILGSGVSYIPEKAYARSVMGQYSVSGAGTHYWIPTADMVGVELVVTNYQAGSAYLRCDVAAPPWAEAIPVSGGVTSGRIGFAATTLTQNVTGSGTAQIVSVASTSGLQQGMVVTLSTGGGDTVTLTNVSPANTTITGIFANSHTSGDVVTPSPTQTIVVNLGGFQGACKVRSDNAFNGTVVPSLSQNGTTYTATLGIGDTASNTAASYGYPYASLVGPSGSWGIHVGSEYYAKFAVSGASLGGFVVGCDVSESIAPLAVISALPTFGAGVTTACPAGSATTPPALTGGTNGVAIGWTSSSAGTITLVIAQSQPSSPAATIQQVYTAVQGAQFNIALPSGYFAYVVSSTSCVYRAI